MTELTVAALQLLSDESATTDLLSFSAIAETVSARQALSCVSDNGGGRSSGRNLTVQYNMLTLA